MPSVTLRHHAPLWHAVRILRFVPKVQSHGDHVMPAIAQLVEHLTVECCSNQMVPGSIPGGRICLWHKINDRRNGRTQI